MAKRTTMVSWVNWDQERADEVLARYGAEGFYVQRDGTLMVESGSVRHEVFGEQLVFGLSDDERVAMAQADKD